MLPHRPARFLAVFVLTLLSLAAPRPAEAQVDVLPPVLSQVSLDEAAMTEADTLRFRFTATDQTGIGTVHAVYESPDGRHLWVSTGEGALGVIEQEIHPTLAAGSYQLAWVNLVDTVEPPNSVVYYRDGRVESEAAGAPTSHALNLAEADFTLLGMPNADTLPPVLTAVGVDSAAVTVGDRLRLAFAASDASGIGTVHAVYDTPDGRTLWLSTGEGDDGMIEFDVPETLLNGDYRLAWVSLTDRALMPNSASYRRNGQIDSDSVGAPQSHAVALAPADFTVSGNDGADTLPPVLESVAIREAELVAAEVLQLDFTATDASGIGTVHFVYQMPTGLRLWVSTADGDLGEAEFQIPTTLPDGTYELEWVNLVDRVNPPNSVVYYSDGRVESEAPDAPTGHELDFGPLAFTVTGNEFRVDREGAEAGGEEAIEIEITPVDEMEDGGGGWAADGASRDIFVTTTLGTLRAGDQTGTRVRARAVGGRRYLAELASGRSGAAIVTVEIEDRGLPPLTVVFSEGRPATMTALSGPASSERGTAITLTATVTSASGTPRGTVSFRRGETEIGTAALNAGGVASLETDSLPAGSHSLTARYAGSTDHAPSTSDALTHAVAQSSAGFFAGGGVVFAQTAACGPALGSHPHAVTVRYRPSELGGLPSELTIAWPEGSEHLALWGAMTPSGDFLGAAGRQSWSRFVFYPTRPRMRVVTRQITRPSGAALAQAEELVLRIRAQNFAAIPDCAATIAATLRRGG